MIVLLLLIAAALAAMPDVLTWTKPSNKVMMPPGKPGHLGLKKVGAAGEFCPTCVSFVDDMLDILLNILLNQGLQGSCADLCGYLPLQVEAQICTFLCDIVGIDAFITLLTDTDPDPIWICEELDQICPISDTAKGNITALQILPASGQQGTTFNINIVFQITKAIGTGELAFNINPPGGQSLGDAILLVATPPGTYNAQVQLDTSQTSSMQQWGPGVYPVQTFLCEGTCGSIHSHSYTLSSRNSTFRITP